MGKAGGSSVFKDIDHIQTVFAVALFLFCCFKFKNLANGHFPRGGCVTLGPDTTWGPLCGFSLVLAPLPPGGHRDLSVLLGKVSLRGGRRCAEGAEQPMHMWGWSKTGLCPTMWPRGVCPTSPGNHSSVMDGCYRARCSL